MRENTKHLSSWAQVTLLSIIFPNFTHLPANLIISCFLIAEWISIVYMYQIPFTRSSVNDRNLGWFYFLTFVNRTTMDMVLSKFLQSNRDLWKYSHAWYSWVKCSSVSSFLRTIQTDFHSGCTSLQYRQQWTQALLSPHPCQHLSSFVCLFVWWKSFCVGWDRISMCF